MGYRSRAAICAAATSVVVATMASDAPARAHTLQTAPETVTRTYNTLFDPSTQRGLSTESDTLIFSLERSFPCESCEAGWSILFEVRDKTTGETVSFRLENDTVQVDEIHIADAKLGWVIGRIQSNVSVINVVKLWTGEVVDSVWAYRPSVSPTKRWVAYVKMYPLRSAFPGSDQYLIYDVTKPPEAHRTDVESSGNLANHVDVGFSMYPPSSANVPGSNLVVPTEDVRLMRTIGFFWLNNSEYAFADEWDGGYDIVVINLGEGDPREAVVHRDTVGVEDFLAETCPRFPDAQVSPLAVSDIRRVNEADGLAVAVTLDATRPGCGASAARRVLQLR